MTLGNEESILSPCPKEFTVNRLRQLAIDSSKTEWIWLVDRDCHPDLTQTKNALSLISQKTDQGLVFIGGLYQSDSTQGLFARSYNHMCNLWSLYHQTPLAGNLLIHKKHLPRFFSLSSIPFSSEEQFISRFANNNRLKVKICPDLKVLHLNEKSLKSWLKTCMQQSAHRQTKKLKGKFRKDPLDYFLKSIQSDPLAVILALFYFALGRFFGFFQIKRKESQSFQSALNN